MKNSFLLLLFIYLSNLNSQNTLSTHQFLLMPPNAGLTALGGISAGYIDKDPSYAYCNPASLSPLMHNQWSMSLNLLPAGITQGNLFTAFTPDSLYTIGGGIHYMHYGRFDETDHSGNVIGSFSGGEYALVANVSRPWKNLRFGAGVKGLYSHIENYYATALMTDFGVMYSSKQQNFQAGLVVRNLGFQIKPYTTGNSEPLPLEINLSFSQKLAYLPFRYFIIIHDLQTWKLLDDYDLSTTTNIFGEEPKKRNQFTSNLFAHFNLAGEFSLGKSLKLRLGYNQELKAEMKSDVVRNISGFSYGVGLDLRRFALSYARNGFHKGGAYNHLSFNLNLGKLSPKPTKKEKHTITNDTEDKTKEEQSEVKEKPKTRINRSTQPIKRKPKEE